MGLLQSATRQDLLQITTGITKCDDYNKMRCLYTSFWSWMPWVHYQTCSKFLEGKKSFNELCIKSRALLQLHCFLSTYRSKWVVLNIGNNNRTLDFRTICSRPLSCLRGILRELLHVKLISNCGSFAGNHIVYKDTIFIFSRNMIWMERERWKFPLWF